LKDLTGGTVSLPSIGLLIRALQSSSDVNVISTPHVVATDNEDSEITVGTNVPFQSGFFPSGISNLLNSGSTSGSTSSLTSLLGTSGGLSNLAAGIQRQNVELRLKMKPQINEGGNVRLSVEVQNEEIASTDPVLGPTTAKRSVKTQIVAKDQSTIVIGGLIQERATRSVKKVPVLGSLPVLGALFRETQNIKQKTNLLVFLTPYIIRDEADYRRIYEKKRKEQEDFMVQFYGKKREFNVDIDYSRKPGPLSKIHQGVSEETSRIENGGPGLPGEGMSTPPAGPGQAVPPAPEPERGTRPPAAPPALQPEPEARPGAQPQPQPQDQAPQPPQPPEGTEQPQE
jgi:general secretion pathway protein D